MIILRSTSADIPYCTGMIDEAASETGLPPAWKDVTSAALTNEEVFLAWENEQPIGYLAFTTAVLPDTSEFVLVERMLFVRKANRGGSAAPRLIKKAHGLATELGCAAMLAGSSLRSNTHAKRLYEACGFKTNLTFRKDTTCVTHLH